MALQRRDFLKGAAGAGAALAMGASLAACREELEPFREDTDWNAGQLKHLLPTVNHTRIRFKASFHTALTKPPVLKVAGRALPGAQCDSRGRFFAFDATDLEPDRDYELALVTFTGDPLFPFSSVSQVSPNFQPRVYWPST